MKPSLVPLLVLAIAFLSSPLHAAENAKRLSLRLNYTPHSALDWTSQYIGEYVTNITLGYQTVPVFVDTRQHRFWVINASCEKCHSPYTKRYNSWESQTFTDLKYEAFAIYFAQSGYHKLEGEVGKEQAKFFNAANINVELLVVSAEDSTNGLSWLGSTIGVIGLGRAIFDEKEGFLTRMKASGLINEKSVGMAFTKGSGSEVVFGGYNDELRGSILSTLSSSVHFYNSWRSEKDMAVLLENLIMFNASHISIASDTPYIILSSKWDSMFLHAMQQSDMMCELDSAVGVAKCRKTGSRVTINDAISLKIEIDSRIYEISKSNLVEIDSYSNTLYYKIIFADMIDSQLVILGTPFLCDKYFYMQEKSDGEVTLEIYSYGAAWYTLYKYWFIGAGAILGSIIVLFVILYICKRRAAKAKSEQLVYYIPPIKKNRLLEEAQRQPSTSVPNGLSAENILSSLVDGTVTVELIAQKIFEEIQSCLQQNEGMGRGYQKAMLLATIRGLPEFCNKPGFGGFGISEKKAIVEKVYEKIEQVYGEW